DTRLAVGYLDQRAVSVFDPANGDGAAELPVGAMGGQTVAWHPHGELLAVGGDDALIHIWDVPSKRKLATLDGHSQNVWQLTFHPDGGLLASHGWDGQMKLWDVATGRPLLRLTLVSVPQFSPDGRLLGVTWRGDQAEFLEVTLGREYHTLVNSAGTRALGEGG